MLMWCVSSLLMLSSLVACAEDASCQDSVTEDVLWCSDKKQCYDKTLHCDGHYDCIDHSDENCTEVEVMQRIHVGSSGNENLAWLVTPVIFCMAVIYVVYKCVKDSICHFRRFRRQEAERPATTTHPDTQYSRLGQISLFARTHIPCTQLGIPNSRNSSSQHLMVVHNSSFTISLGSDAGAFSNGYGINNPSCMTSPPSYDEAMATVALPPPSTPPPEDPDLPAYAEVVAATSNCNGIAVFTIGDPEDSNDDPMQDDLEEEDEEAQETDRSSSESYPILSQPLPESVHSLPER